MSALDPIVQRVPETAWEPCEVRSDTGQVRSRWCPLVAFGEPRLALGLAPGGKWLWGEEGADTSIVYQLDGQSVIGSLPILERPLPMVRSEAARTAGRLGLPLTVVDALPVTEIVGAALSTRADYWVDLALEWLEADVDRHRLADDIAAASSDGRLSQRTRHRLQRLTRA